MTEQSKASLHDLLKRTSDFVIKQRGQWDHTGWSDFLSSVSRGGTDLNAEMQEHLGQTLEAVKSFYAATASIRGVNESMANLMKDTARFVSAHKGIWGHAEWEEFLRTVQTDATAWNEERVAYLGGILESSKQLYSLPLPTAGSKETTEVPVTNEATRKKKK